jgi:hypothetical protein
MVDKWSDKKDNGTGSYTPRPRKHHRWPWIVLGIGAVLVVLSVASRGSFGTTTPTLATAAPIPITGYTATNTDTDSPCADCTPEGDLNVTEVAPVTTTTQPVDPQVQEAIDAADSYLNFKAFSRDGLIDQLDSPYGSDFSQSIATAAVDSLNVDYNAQAASAARDYLNLEAFSCSGLIAQLDSAYGDQYTKAQATYGAHQTSACG